MLNYEEELKKFKPCIDVEDVEEAVYSQNMTDVIDLLKEMEAGRRAPAAASDGRRSEEFGQ